MGLFRDLYLVSLVLLMVYILTEIKPMVMPQLQYQAQQFGIKEMKTALLTKAIQFFIGFFIGLGLWGLTLMVLLILN